MHMQLYCVSVLPIWSYALCTKYLSSQVTPVGRLCLQRFSIDSCFGSNWQPASWQGSSNLKSDKFALADSPAQGLSLAKTEWQQGVWGYWFFWCQSLCSSIKHLNSHSLEGRQYRRTFSVRCQASCNLVQKGQGISLRKGRCLRELGQAFALHCASMSLGSPVGIQSSGLYPFHCWRASLVRGTEEVFMATAQPSRYPQKGIK